MRCNKRGIQNVPNLDYTLHRFDAVEGLVADRLACRMAMPVACVFASGGAREKFPLEPGHPRILTAVPRRDGMGVRRALVR